MPTFVLPSKQAASLQKTPRNVVAFARELQHDDWMTRHSHTRAQVIYAVRGVMQVRTSQGVWVVPPQQALWVPPGVEHEIFMLSQVAMRTLYVQAEAAAPLGDRCVLLQVSALLRELILGLLEEPVDYDEDGRGGYLAKLILLEIAKAERIPMVIPWPHDRRLVSICETLLQHPGHPNSLEDWAAEVGASARTLIRLFQKETGLRFRHWQLQVQVSDALLRLERGESVERIAQALGYQSTSAFSGMFRKLAGKTPGQYAADVRARRD